MPTQAPTKPSHNSLMRTLLLRGALGFLVFYKRFISPVLFALGVRCRFYPTCSCYAKEALMTHGLFRGMVLALGRLARCNPLCAGGVDPVPPAPQAHIHR